MSSKEEKPIKEVISAIYRELNDTGVYDDEKNERTLKSYLHNISLKISEHLAEQKQELFNQKQSVSWALGILSFIAICLLANSAQENPDFDWIKNNKLALKLWGVSLAAIYIGASLERSSFFKSLWSFSATKIVVSISFSGLVVYSTGKAAGVINGVFGVDATTFPITYAFTTAIAVFNLIAPFLFFISLGAIVHLFNVFAWIQAKRKGGTYELPPYHSFVFPVLTSVIMLNAWGWSNNELSESRLPQKAYMMAHSLDFNSNHECGNLKSGVQVVFLGASHNSVLVDSFMINNLEFSSFFNHEIDIPDKFYRIKCEYPTYKESKYNKELQRINR